MKKRLVMLIMGVMLTSCFAGCDAEKVNTAIDAVGDAAGVDTENIKVDQETLDKIDKTIDDAIDTGKKVIEDEDVQGAFGGMINAVKDAASSIGETASEAQDAE